MKFRKNEFVKVIKGQHKRKQGAVIADKGETITVRTYPFSNYIKVSPLDVRRCNLTCFRK